MHSKQNKVRSSSQISNLSGNESQDWIYDCRFCNIKGLKVVKKWKIASFLKEEDFFGPRQNFANANKQLAICHDIYVGICCLPISIARVTTGSVCHLLYWNKSSSYNILVLLRKTTIARTFYFLAEKESVCVRKK